MSKMVYQWRDTKITGLNPQVVGQHFEYLRKKYGLTPPIVVEDARRKNSPIHSYFEWDDRKAATAHRIQQARMLIGGLVVSVNESTTTARAFVSVTAGDVQEYTSLKIALSDSELRKQILDEALWEAAQWKKKYADMKELARIFEAIDATEKQVAS